MVTAVYQRPWLYEKQQNAFFNGARYKVIEASTKAGKSVGALIWLFEQSLVGSFNWNYWFISPVFAQTKVMFRRLKVMLQDQVPFVANETELKITLPNGAAIWFKSGERPDSLYGEDVYAAVVDEASRMRYEAFIALRSTLTATRGPVVIIGNVRGRKNWFWRMARKAETGNYRNYKYTKLTAYDAVEGGVLAKAEIEDAKNELPEEVFKELYLAEATEDGSNPFGLRNISACISPLAKEKTIAWGVDLARKHDFTVITGMAQSGKVSYYDRYQRPWNDTTHNLISLPDGAMLIDSTGVGDPILDSVQRKRKRTKGFVFTSKSKQQLLENLQLHIMAKDIGFPEVYKDELENIEYTYTRTGVQYSAPEGLFDDKVMSLALGVAEWDEVRRRGVFIGRAA